MHPVDQQQLIEQELEAFKDEELSVPAGVPYRMEEVATCIHEHLFMREVTVAWVLDQCGITDHGFSQRFKCYFHRTPHKYIETKRVEAAKRLLAHEELAIADVGFQVGYSYYSTFFRVFKHHTGCSPSAYREKLLG